MSLSKSNLNILSSYTKNYRKFDFYSIIFLKKFISHFWAYHRTAYSRAYLFVSIPLISSLKRYNKIL